MRKNLVNMRKKHNLTQQETAKMLHIAVRHYRALESGSSNGSIKVWQSISKLFQKDISFLLEQKADEIKKPDCNQV